jgi:putative cardiolipin synthase
MRLAKDKQSHTMISRLHDRVGKLHKNLLIESPYFIPRENGMKYFIAMRKRGVKVRILTNSFASNDVIAAYSGYRSYREELLRHGVELYELRDDAGSSKIINRTSAKTEVTTGLHAKVIVFDEKDLFIGSFNLDPRSSNINTEGGLYVQSPKLAKRVMAYMDEGINLENAYRLGLDKKGQIIWTTIENGKEVIYTSEPKLNAWGRLKVNFYQMLPLEGQL